MKATFDDKDNTRAKLPYIIAWHTDVQFKCSWGLPVIFLWAFTDIYASLIHSNQWPTIIQAQKLRDAIFLFPGECLRILVFLLDDYVSVRFFLSRKNTQPVLPKVVPIMAMKFLPNLPHASLCILSPIRIIFRLPVSLRSSSPILFVYTSTLRQATFAGLVRISINHI